MRAVVIEGQLVTTYEYRWLEENLSRRLSTPLFEPSSVNTFRLRTVSGRLLRKEDTDTFLSVRELDWVTFEPTRRAWARLSGTLRILAADELGLVVWDRGGEGRDVYRVPWVARDASEPVTVAPLPIAWPPELLGDDRPRLADIRFDGSAAFVAFITRPLFFPPTCSNACASSFNGRCEDGGMGSESDVCALGTDCTDCGNMPRRAPPVCYDSCPHANDGVCDDRRDATDPRRCDLGTDCADCGGRDIDSRFDLPMDMDGLVAFRLDVATGALTEIASLPEAGFYGPTPVWFEEGPDGGLILASGGEGRDVELWRVRGTEKTLLHRHPRGTERRIDLLDVTATGLLVGATSSGGSFTVYERSTGFGQAAASGTHERSWLAPQLLRVP